jgi:hypothetical protein
MDRLWQTSLNQTQERKSGVTTSHATNRHTTNPIVSTYPTTFCKRAIYPVTVSWFQVTQIMAFSVPNGLGAWRADPGSSHH